MEGKTKSIYVQTRAILSWIISWLYMSEKFENAEATFNQIVFMFLSECNNTNFSLLKIHYNNGNINNSWSFHVKRQKEYLVDIAFLKIIILCSFDSSILFYFSCLYLNRKKWICSKNRKSTTLNTFNGKIWLLLSYVVKVWHKSVYRYLMSFNPTMIAYNIFLIYFNHN